MNYIQGKVWGNTEPLFCKNNVEMHRIEVVSGHYCSKHCHEYKHNMLYVESGKLKITVWKNDYDLVDETFVSSGQSTVVPPKEYHFFEAMEDTIAYEIYWVELNKKDILRENHGGKS